MFGLSRQRRTCSKGSAKSKGRPKSSKRPLRHEVLEERTPVSSSVLGVIALALAGRWLARSGLDQDSDFVASDSFRPSGAKDRTESVLIGRPLVEAGENRSLLRLTPARSRRSAAEPASGTSVARAKDRLDVLQDHDPLTTRETLRPAWARLPSADLGIDALLADLLAPKRLPLAPAQFAENGGASSVGRSEPILSTAFGQAVAGAVSAGASRFDRAARPVRSAGGSSITLADDVPEAVVSLAAALKAASAKRPSGGDSPDLVITSCGCGCGCLPVASVVANVDDFVEHEATGCGLGTPNYFEISVEGGSTGCVEVFFHFSDSEAESDDFSAYSLSGLSWHPNISMYSVTIPTNSQAKIYIGNANDGDSGKVEPDEKITLTISRTDYCDLGNPFTADMTIVDDDAWKLNVSAVDAVATERMPGVVQDEAKFLVTRYQDVERADDFTYFIDVHYEISGTAAYGADYTFALRDASDEEIPGASLTVNGNVCTVHFPSKAETQTGPEDPGQEVSEMYVVVRPVFDWIDEGELYDPDGGGTPHDQLGETVRLTIVDVDWPGLSESEEAHDPIGTPSTAEAEIKDGAIVLIRTDSNNDRTIDDADLDPALDQAPAPGRIVALNGDDDNSDGIADKSPGQSPVAGEDDLGETQLVVWVDSLTAEDPGVVLQYDVFVYGSPPFALWETDDKQNEVAYLAGPLFTLDAANTTFHETVFLEGLVPAQFDLTLTAASSPTSPVLPTGADSARFTVVSYGFVPFTPQTTHIDPMPIPEANWRANGVGVRRNGDYDNGGASRDWWVTGPIEGEDDLTRTLIEITPTTGVAYRLRSSSTDVAVWTSSEKGGTAWDLSGDGVTLVSGGNVWVEWTSFNGGQATVTLSVWDTVHNVEALTRDVVYRPFESATAYFVGEFQTPGDPEASPGPNEWVIQELLDGYDVHVWDDGHDWWSWDEADEWGRGPAYDEIVNAVNNRGVQQVALLGYSHGGGTVYHVAWRLAQGYAASNGDTITQPYSLVFTSYLDAIRNNRFAQWSAEDRRPPEADFLLNQYQTNASPRGGHVNDLEAGDIEHDRTGLGVTHSDEETGIHVNPTVVGLVTAEFQDRVDR